MMMSHFTGGSSRCCPAGAAGTSCDHAVMTAVCTPNWWERTVVPRLVDVALRGRDIGELRQRACAGLTGRVLELGFGSGLNTRLYPDAVAAVDAVEPSDVGWRLSERRRAESGTPVRRVGLDGQALAADDAAYDCVLSTFTLCTIPDVALAFREVRRVLRPGGTFHFLEHGSGPTERVRSWQRRLEPAQRRLAGGCHLTRDVPALVAEAGFEVTDLDQRYLAGPAVTKPWAYLSLGRAS
jgi:SAM-dependent methyltransferase